MARPSGIFSSSITAYNLNFGMRVQPHSATFGCAVRQDINHPVALQVDQNSAEVLPTAKGEIIYTELYYRPTGLVVRAMMRRIIVIQEVCMPMRWARRCPKSPPVARPMA
jgi:hypothetical protein